MENQEVPPAGPGEHVQGHILHSHHSLHFWESSSGSRRNFCRSKAAAGLCPPCRLCLMLEAKSISWFLAPDAAWSSPGRIHAPFLPLALPGESRKVAMGRH